MILRYAIVFIADIDFRLLVLEECMVLTAKVLDEGIRTQMLGGNVLLRKLGG